MTKTLLSAALFLISLSCAHAATQEMMAANEDDRVPDIHASVVSEYQCELSNTLTIYSNSDDGKHIALRWKKKLYSLKRIETTTGANRFENHKAGFVWINIPAKGMLLDSLHGQQLANECKTSTPMALAPAEPVVASIR